MLPDQRHVYNENFLIEDRMRLYLEYSTSLGSNDLVQEVEWEASAEEPCFLRLITAGSDIGFVCRLIGTVLPEEFHMSPHGDLDLMSADVDLMLAAYTFRLGPPALNCARKHNSRLLDHFRCAIRNSKRLSEIADDSGRGTGMVDFSNRDDGSYFCFRIPIFEARVSLHIQLCNNYN